MTPLMDEDAKYTVVKADGTPVDDAVVIRLKDPFAATALHTYANTILSVMELMAETISDQEHQRMIGVADYFSQKAAESEKIAGKRLPD